MRAIIIRSRIWTSSIALAAAVLAASCGGSGGGSTDTTRAPVEHALARFTDCNELRDAIVEDARQKIALQAQQLRVYASTWFGPSTPTAAEPTPAATASPAAGADRPGPRDFTDTNTQVPGVDEADVVETDGTHLYLLRGGDLVILDAWPPEATALRAHVAVEGDPVGMFVAGGRALVVSTVVHSGMLGGADACHVLGPPLPAFNGGIADVPCGATFTKVTLFDLTDAAPRIAREIYLEGAYVSARRHGAFARVVVERGWGLPPSVPEPWSVIELVSPPPSREEFVRRIDDWERRAIAAAEATPLAEWLPARVERIAGALLAGRPECGDVHVPPPALTGDGTTRVFAFDMSVDAGDVWDTVVLGGATSIFASTDTLVLAQPDWSWHERGETTDRTALHVFTLPADSAETTYRASGFVPGVPLSQFAFDVQDDVVRVATTISTPPAVPPPPTITTTLAVASRVTTLRIDGAELATIGATDDLAPGERMMAVRFLGTRAYLVTFRRVDPLFVVDLADPAHPHVLGQVDLPGFSEYLHPLDAAHLVTIGVDADAFGTPHGLALRLFDVSDPTAPRLTDVHALAGLGASPAEADHLAFTFSPRHGLLAIPYSRFDGVFRSSLVLVGVDASSGFSARGEIDHQSLAADACAGNAAGPCVTFVAMERGVFIDDWIYSISSAGLRVNAVADLAPVATVLLPSSAPTPVPLPEPGPEQTPFPMGT